MKVDKQIIATQEIDINIDRITLLSIEEYERYEENISPIEDWWWLRSPGYDSRSAAVVHFDGSVNHLGNYVYDCREAVRPVVVLRLNPEFMNLKIGDKFFMANRQWTVICENMALCDSVVGHTYFCDDWKADDANNYDKAYIKKWLEAWACKNGIVIEPKEG